MLTLIIAPGYSYLAAAKSAAGISSPNYPRRTSAANGAFLLPLWRLCVGGFGLPGSLDTGLLTRVQSPPSISSDAGDSNIQGVPPMFPSVRSLQDRAAAHRAMARAALFSDSSARVRMRRYNHHMSKARAFDAAAGAGGES